MKYQGLIQGRNASTAAFAGPLLMVSAAFMFTLSNLLIKMFSSEYSPWHIAFYRFAGGVVLVVALFRHRKSIFSCSNKRLLIFRGCVGAVSFICFIAAIRLLPVSTALVIVYSYPAFAAIFSYLIYKESIGAAQSACIGTAIVGIGILLDFQTSSNFAGYIFALASSILAGLVVTLVRELRKSNGSVIIFLYVCVIGAAVTLPKFLMQPILPHSSMGWIMLLSFILFAGMGQLLMNQGFYYCRSWEGGVMMSSEALFTVAAGIWLLNDPVTWRFFIGGMIIFASSVMLNRMKATHAAKRYSEL